MKKFLCLLLLFAIAISSFANNKSLLKNGDFEKISTNGFPEAWYIFDEGANSEDSYKKHNILIQSEPNVVKQGRRSASMLHGAPAYTKWIMLRQDITKFSSGKYVIAGYVRWSGKSMARPCIALHLIDKNGGLEHPLIFNISNKPTPNDWVYFYEEFNVGANVKTIGVNIIATDGPAHVYVDDIGIWRDEDAPKKPQSQFVAPPIIPKHAGHQAKTTGNISERIELIKVGEEYYFKRPNGQLFWDIAMNHTSYPTANCWWDSMNPKRGELVRKKFPNMSDWNSYVVNLFKQAGFTSFGAWSYMDIKKEAEKNDIYYWQILAFNALNDKFLLRNQYGTPIPVGGTSRMADPFDLEWQQAVDKHIFDVVNSSGKLGSVMGYFPENEISLGVVPLYGYISTPAASKAFANWLQKRYDNDIKKLNQAWTSKEKTYNYPNFAAIAKSIPNGTDAIEGSKLLADFEDFEDYMVEYYVDFTIQAIRKHDPDAIIGSPRLPGEALAQFKPLRHFSKFDITAINAYPGRAYSTQQIENLKKIYEITKRPIVITEWTIGATDKNHGGVASTQKERGELYIDSMKQLNALPFVVGMHYQMWFSPDVIGGNQFGVIDNNESPYEPFWQLISDFQTKLNQK